MTQDSPPLAVDGLTFRYRSAAAPSISDLNFVAAAGDLLLIAGDSGSGKSTLLRCLNGLIPRSYGGDLSGRIAIDGQAPAGMGLAQLAQMVGTILQDPDRQIVTSYVERQVAFGPENLGWPRERIRAAVAATLERLRITHLRNRETGGLSGGERQKVALAGLLSMNPHILLLDEPLASLDPASAREALALFRELADDGRAVLLVEHRVEDALVARPEISWRWPIHARSSCRRMWHLHGWGLGTGDWGLGSRIVTRHSSLAQRRATRCWSWLTSALATAMGRRFCAESR